MPDLLTIERLSAGYGEAVVLNEISLALAEGQSLALLGRNGMGKTTLINSIVGVTRFIGGTIALDGRDITPLRPDQRAHAGIGWVPQERNIFKSLTVEENLTAVARPGRWTLARIYELFPRLHERRRNLGNQLSGGEQQMLAVGRALILNPRVMLLDEPLEGLAPILVEELLRRCGASSATRACPRSWWSRTRRRCWASPTGRRSSSAAPWCYEGASADLSADRAVLESYLGVTAGRTPPRRQGQALRRSSVPRAFARLDRSHAAGAGQFAVVLWLTTPWLPCLCSR